MNSVLTESILKNINTKLGIRIAFSGGADSTALLLACYQLREQGKIMAFDAIYIHHQELHSDQTQQKCEAICKKLNVPLLIRKISQSYHTNKEAHWRKERLQLITAATSKNTQILLGQHLEDQAETFLLQALRGAGIDGLSGMSNHSSQNGHCFIRPFLQTSKTKLIEYLKSHNIMWVEDPSNQDQSLQRNYLRHTIFPALQAKWPAASETLARSATNCQIKHRPNDDAFAINQLRMWLKHGDIHLNKTQVENLFYQLTKAPYDRMIEIDFDDHILLKHKNSINLLPKSLTKSHIIVNPSTHIIKYSQYVQISMHVQKIGFGIGKEYWQHLSIRPRIGGERIQISRQQPRQKVKKLLQSWQLPQYIKSAMPLIYYKDQLIGIPGFRLNHAYCTHEESLNMKLNILDHTSPSKKLLKLNIENLWHNTRIY